MKSTMNLAMFVSHAFFGLASFASGAVLVAFLLRDKAISGGSESDCKDRDNSMGLSVCSRGFALCHTPRNMTPDTTRS